MKKGNTFLSVVITCYNEIENLQRGVLDEMKSFLEKQKFTWEVVINDDGSSDESLKFIRRFVEKNQNFRVLGSAHAGKAFGIWTGIQAANGENILLTDMDQSVSLSEVKKLLPYFEKNFAVVIGSRGAARKGAPWYRKLIAMGFMAVRRLLILPNIVDTQCGFKAFKRETAEDIFKRLQIFQGKQEAEGWKVTAFDVEVLFVAQKRGYKIAEVPVEWLDRDIAKGKKHNLIKESIEMGKEILRVRLNDLRGIYES